MVMSANPIRLRMNELCIRDWQHGRLVSQDVPCVVADVFANKMVSGDDDQCDSGEERHNLAYVCVHWDSTEGASVSSIQLDTDDSVSFSHAFCASLDKRPSLFDTFIHSIYSDLKSKLIQVNFNPIMFVFINLQDDPFLSQQNQFITLLKSLLSRVVKPLPHIQVKYRRLQEWAPTCECDVHAAEKGLGSRSLVSAKENFVHFREQLRTLDEHIESECSSIELNVLETKEILSRALNSSLLTDDHGGDPLNVTEESKSSYKQRHGYGKVRTVNDVQHASQSTRPWSSPLEHRLGRGEDESSLSTEERRPMKTLADIKKTESELDQKKEEESKDLTSLLHGLSLEDMLTGRFKLPEIAIGQTSSGEGFIETIKKSSEPGDADLVVALTDAYKQTLPICADGNQIPMSKEGISVVLCLDTSASISEEHLIQMKEVVTQFINELEENANERGMEENVGLVAIGGKPRLLHPLTNDFGPLLDCLETLELWGNSNLLETLSVLIASVTRGYCDYKGKALEPRVIIFTDGLVTTHGDPSESLQPNDKAKTEFLRSLKSLKINAMLTGGNVWVPIGNADRAFLKKVAMVCNGEFVEMNDVKNLANYHHIIKTSAHVVTLIEEENLDINRPNGHIIIANAIESVCPEMLFEEREDVVYQVKKYFKMKREEGGDKTSPYRLDNVCQNPQMPRLGTRVRRGIDWKWKNQDNGGPGTIFNHDDKQLKSWVWVHWDHGHSNAYRYGAEGCFDVLISDDPPPQPSGQTIDIGVHVERGPHWQDSHGDEDGGIGSTGIVIRKGRERVKVIWKNGDVKEYSYGENDKYEVAICSLHAEFTLQSNEPHNLAEGNKCKGTAQDTPFVWQRLGEDGSWTSYSVELDEMLKKDYQKKPDGVTLIRRDGKSYRISFSNLTERCLASGKTTKIRKHVG